jgi:hypothetical protein
MLSPLMVSARRLDSWVQRHGRLFPFFPSAGRCAGCVFFRYSKALCFFCCYAQFALFTCVNSKLRCELRTTTESRCKLSNAIELPQSKFLSIFCGRNLVYENRVSSISTHLHRVVWVGISAMNSSSLKEIVASLMQVQ